MSDWHALCLSNIDEYSGEMFYNNIVIASLAKLFIGFCYINYLM